MKVFAHAIAAVLLCGGISAALAQALWLRQPDGKIVTVIEDGGVAGPGHQLIERRHPDGSLDASFGSEGRVWFSLGTDSLGPRSVRIDDQGRLLVVGTAFGNAADRSGVSVARFLPDGHADSSWGARGTRLMASADGEAQGVDVLPMPDGSMLLLGEVGPESAGQAVLWRLRPDGAPDPGFGDAGALRVPQLDGARTMSLRLADDGAALIASQRAQGGGSMLEVVRWQPGGEALQLVSRQPAPAEWQGSAALERRDGRWQWTSASGTGSLPLAGTADAGTGGATLGQALFSPFVAREEPAMRAPISPRAGSAVPALAWVFLVPAIAMLGWVAWRRRVARVADLGLLDPRASMLERALGDLAGASAGAASDPPPDTGTAAPGAVAIATACRNGLARPMFGKPDDLKRIKGIASVLEKRLHSEGIFYLWQIAQWSEEDVADVGRRLSAFRGRIERDRWVAQAVELAR